MSIDYKEKYLKYKQKYLELKNQKGGTVFNIDILNTNIDFLKSIINNINHPEPAWKYQISGISEKEGSIFRRFKTEIDSLHEATQKDDTATVINVINQLIRDIDKLKAKASRSSSISSLCSQVYSDSNEWVYIQSEYKTNGGYYHPTQTKRDEPPYPILPKNMYMSPPNWAPILKNSLLDEWEYLKDGTRWNPNILLMNMNITRLAKTENAIKYGYDVHIMPNSINHYTLSLMYTNILGEMTYNSIIEPNWNSMVVIGPEDQTKAKINKHINEYPLTDVILSNNDKLLNWLLNIHNI